MNIRFDINLLRNITGNPCPGVEDQENEANEEQDKNIFFCTPEMITKYVRKLRKEKNNDNQSRITKLLEKNKPK